jgi:hypothetical protein
MAAPQRGSPALVLDDLMRNSWRQWSRFLSEFIRLSHHVITGPYKLTAPPEVRVSPSQAAHETPLRSSGCGASSPTPSLGWLQSKDVCLQIRVKGKKGKAIPVTGPGGPYGCETSGLPHFLYSRLTDGGEFVSRTLTPRRFLALMSVRG